MNDSTKELFLKIMGLKPCERTLNWEFGYWAGTIERWYKEGLPKVKGLPKNLFYGDGIFGPGHPSGGPNVSGNLTIDEFDLSSFFNFDEKWMVVPYNYWIFPGFEKKILYEDDKYIEYFDTDGIKKRELRDKSSMPFFLEFPLKTREDWEKIKEERLNLDSINKRFVVDKNIYFKKIKDRTFPLAILDDPVGFFGSIRFLIGEKNLFVYFYDEPNLIKDILRHLCELWISIAEELTSKIEFDIAVFWEDMSGKQGSLIGPVTFREFMSPLYKKLIDFLKSKKIRYFNVDSDGYVSQLIPLFMEAGINSMYPFEQQAGNDLIELRKKFPDLRMLGGFDKNSLYKGKEHIDKELEKMAFMINQGGYIPYADHLVPPNCSWENYKYYREKLSRIIYSTRVLN